MKYEALEKAREILELHDRISLAEIKEQYRTQMKKWHPDICTEPKEVCEEQANRISEAYQLIMEYVSNYKYAFTPEEVSMQLSGAEWWMHRFGQGTGYKSKK